jgi:spermidine synthase
MSSAENLATAFCTGASVMIIEILGTRVISPVFGVSLFVWSALLAVTLGALATGYFFGGVLVDRRPSIRTLNAAVALSGAALALAPLARRSVLLATQTLGPRSGPLVRAFLLFGPALVALGAVGPVAARLMSADVLSTGRKVGVVFAVSTAGSVCGTFLVGYWLIPSFETDHILIGTSALLVIGGAVPLALRGRHFALTAACVPLLASFVPAGALPAGFELVDRSQSMYGLVEVIDDTTNKVRFLRVDHSVIGGDLIPEHDTAFTFLYRLEFLRFLRPQATSMLQLGLGTGSLVRTLHGTPLKTDIVELDPAVVSFATKHFKFRPTGEVIEEDARTFINRTQRKYDIVVHDTFTGGSTPEHLLSKEVFARIHSLLTPGGLLAFNFVGGESGSEGDATMLVGQTLRAEFPHVRAFVDEGHNRITNVTFFASDENLPFEIIEKLRFQHRGREEARSSLFAHELHQPSTVNDTRLITDEFNPLNRLQLPIAEAHAAAMNTLLPPAVWVN